MAEYALEARFDRMLYPGEAPPIGPPIDALAAPVVEKVYEGRAAKVHIDDVLRYPTGTEKRDLAELRRIAEQLPGKPMTLYHPDDVFVRLKDVPVTGNGRVVGRVESARLDGDYVIATFRITDAQALEEIDAGLTDLSLGYLSHKDDDGYQRGIFVDHLALVPRGRCSTCALRADADTHQDCGCGGAEQPISEPVHATPGPIQAITCQCKEHAVRSVGMSEAITTESKMDEVQKQLDAAKAELETLKGELAAAQTKVDQAEIERDNAKKDAEAASKKITDATAAVDAATVRADAADAALKTATEEHAVALEAASKAASAKAKLDADVEYAKTVDDKVDLVIKAREIVGDATTIESKQSVREIKRAVIKHVDGDDVPANKRENDEYIDGLYDGALKRADIAIASRKTVVIETEQVRQDAAKDASKPDALVRERDAKSRMNDRVTETWKSQKN